jgi:hypothetical protein
MEITAISRDRDYCGKRLSFLLFPDSIFPVTGSIQTRPDDVLVYYDARHPR